MQHDLLPCVEPEEHVGNALLHVHLQDGEGEVGKVTEGLPGDGAGVEVLGHGLSPCGLSRMADASRNRVGRPCRGQPAREAAGISPAFHRKRASGKLPAPFGAGCR
jgi:hypothetical protein